MNFFFFYLVAATLSRKLKKQTLLSSSIKATTVLENCNTQLVLLPVTAYKTRSFSVTSWFWILLLRSESSRKENITVKTSHVVWNSRDLTSDTIDAKTLDRQKEKDYKGRFQLDLCFSFLIPLSFIRKSLTLFLSFYMFYSIKYLLIIIITLYFIKVLYWHSRTPYKQNHIT